MTSETESSESASRPHFKACPEDFIVDELPLYPALGEGPHTLLRIEKRLRTTDQVARDLARAVGCSNRDIGYAGRKDRVALTRQWFSVPDLAPERALALELPGATVMEASRHRNKLRTGHLAGNHFEIWIRGLTPQQIEQAKTAIEEVRLKGFANRYGEQRFGRDGDNPERALEILRGGKRPKDRRQARFLISALQSQVFNRVLHDRPLPLDCLEWGDLAMKHDSGGVFCVEDVELENQRAAQFEISPTGPIFGTKMTQPLGAPLERETAALLTCEIPSGENLKPPRGISLKGARRSMRVRPGGLCYVAEETSLQLKFDLEPGSYATVLLETVLGPLAEGAGEFIA